MLDVPETLCFDLRTHLLNDGCPGLPTLLQLFQWSKQHVEGRLVNHQGFSGLRGDRDRAVPGLIRQQGTLAEALHSLGALGLLLDEDVEGTLCDDVNVVGGGVALLDDLRALWDSPPTPQAVARVRPTTASKL